MCGHPTWKPGGGKNASNLRGRKFLGTNPRGVHAASRGKIWRVEMTVNRGSNTTYGDHSLRSRQYSRAQGGKLEIPPAQKHLSILSSAHRAHGSPHTNVFALENQSEREFLIMLFAGLQCSKRCQFNNCFVFFCHGEQNNSHETFVKAYTVNFPTPVGKIAITSLPSNKCWIDILCSYFKLMGRPIADK